MKNSILIQCGDHDENVERILPLAMFCKRQGYDPVVLIYEKNNGLKFLSRGIDTYRLGLRQSDTWYRKVIRSSVISALGIDDVYKGCAIADVFQVDVLNGHRLTKGRKNSLVRHIDRLVTVLDDVDPCMVFIWNGYTGRVANVLRALSSSRRLPSMYLERGAVSKSVFIDPSGVNGLSALNKIKSIPQSSQESTQTLVPNTPASLEAVNALIPKEQESKKIIFIPLQVQRDTNILMHSNGINSMELFLDVVLSSLSADYFAVVRPHPEEIDELKIDIAMYENVMLTAKGELDDWLERCDAVVTINSTVGLQALLKHRPLFTFGNSIYTNKGMDIAVDADIFKDSIDAYFKEPSVDVDAVHDFYDYLLQEHTCLDEHGCGVLKKAVLKRSHPRREAHMFNHWKVIADEYVRDVERLFKHYYEKKFSCVMVTVQLDDIYLDLTYRNTKEELTKTFLEEQLVRFLEPLNIAFTEHVISKERITIPDSLYILVTDRDDVLREDDEFAFVVDPFFQIRPSMFTTKRTLSKRV